MSIRVGLVGHRGYSGAELVRLLSRHSQAEVLLLDHREARSEGPRYLQRSGATRAPATADAAKAERLDLIFLATPPEASLELAPAFLGVGARVVDLSGAFRLKTSDHYERWYGQTHPEVSFLSEAAYGLPEFYRDDIQQARLVANPGCYPTAANLALRPLVENGLIDKKSGVVCDAKSGVSGAGRRAASNTSFCEVTENLSAYAVLDHRHVPEILMTSGLEERDLSFVAQLIPVDRGILETIYFRGARPLTAAAIAETYARCYRDEPFIRIHAPGSMPDLHGVAHTNFCDIGVSYDEATGRGVIVSAIDNLGKGAAGQAVQNMNLLFSLPETEGLL